MMKNDKKYLLLGIAFLLVFAIWTALLFIVDVRAIGPFASSVGFSSFNKACHNFFGENISLYYLTDWLSIVPISLVICFAILGFIQLLKRKSFLKLDSSLIITGVFYLAVFALFLVFETCIVNYRPVLISGELEASYPSSTTLLTSSVIPSAIILFRMRIKSKLAHRVVTISLSAFMVFMILARLISGVHWITDIIGGILISTGLVLLYVFFIKNTPTA